MNLGGYNSTARNIFNDQGSKPSSEKTLQQICQTRQVLCFPTGLLQDQSLQLQEQEKLLTKKGQQIYFHKF